MHNVEFAKRVMKAAVEQKKTTWKRIQALMTGIIDEQPLENYPLSFNFSMMCSSLSSSNMDKRQFVYAMNKTGHKVIQTYYSPTQWKTDAPPEIIYDVFKAFKHHDCKGDKKALFANLNNGQPGNRILQKELINKNINFDAVHEKDADKKEDEQEGMQKVLGKNRKQKKYYDNPAPNWGPKPRATGK